MNPKPTALFTLATLLILAPLAAKDRKTPLQPGKYEEWNGNIDQMEIVKTFKLADYQRVRVEPLDTKTTPLPPADDKRHAFVVNVLGRSTDLVLAGMRNKFHPQPPIPIEVGAFVAAAPAPAADPSAGAAVDSPPVASPPPRAQPLK